MNSFSARVVGAVAVCLALGVGATLLAQNAPAPASAENTLPETKFTTGITDVNVLFTVTDKKGRFVTDLTVNDFEVSENKKPQFIQQFTAESDLPLRLALLIDTSNSIR
jgi:hypothetical protein